MSNNFQLIRDLLDHVEAFEKQGGEGGIKAFAFFLKDKVYSVESESSAEPATYRKENFMNFRSIPEVEFSVLLTGLFRFAKHYLKKAFSKTAFNTIDEFGFLATLLKEGSLLKNELISEHMMEMSSGSEIIKRLIKNGLIHEYKDEYDGRAKRVALTEAGKREIFLAFDEMYKVSEIIKGNLQPDELTEALAILNKLTVWHKHIHEHDKNAPIEALHEKYVD